MTTVSDTDHPSLPGAHETHRWGYFLRTKLSNEDYFFERRRFLNCSNAFGVAVLLLGGSSCMVKMCPKLPLYGTAKQKSFWGGPKTQEPKLL